VGIEAQECFTQSDEEGNMQDGIWRELMQLHAIHTKKPTKKFWAGRERLQRRKARKITRNPGCGIGMILVLGKTSSAEATINPSFLAFARSTSVRVEVVQPAACFFTDFFCHLLAMRDALDGHAMAGHLELQERVRVQGRRRSGSGGGAKDW
jgi:hypothetical protein